MHFCFQRTRDDDLLDALAVFPHLDAGQLLALSETFARPFTCKRHVNHRLRTLADEGLIQRFHFHPQNRAAPFYYALTRKTYRELVPHAPVPKPMFFRELARTRQAHAWLVNTILVRLRVLAHRDKLQFENFIPEDAIRHRLSNGDILQTDGDFDLTDASGHTCSFHLEADNGTEPQRSRSNPAALTDMVRKYEQLADDRRPERFRVLFVTTGTPRRVQTFLKLAAEHARHRRWIFYGITLNGLLRMPSLLQPYVLNHALDAAPVFTRSHRSDHGVDQNLLAQNTVVHA